MYSKYLSQTFENWKPSDGIVFAEPIRKRDEKLFEKRRCTFCQEEFWIDKKLAFKPEACEKCFAARKNTKTPEMKPRSLGISSLITLK